MGTTLLPCCERKESEGNETQNKTTTQQRTPTKQSQNKLINLSQQPSPIVQTKNFEEIDASVDVIPSTGGNPDTTPKRGRRKTSLKSPSPAEVEVPRDNSQNNKASINQFDDSMDLIQIPSAKVDNSKIIDAHDDNISFGVKKMATGKEAQKQPDIQSNKQSKQVTQGSSQSKQTVKELEPQLESVKIEQLQNLQQKDHEINFDIPGEEPMEQNDDIIADEFIFKVSIDILEINYKLCDDFGNRFKPYIEINFEDYSPLKINIISSEDKDKLNTSLNTSTNGEVNSSLINFDPNASLNSSNINTSLSISPSKFSKMSSSNYAEKDRKVYEFKSVCIIT